MLRAAFVFLAPNADPKTHTAVVTTEQVELTTVGVASYKAAEEAVEELVESGVTTIELCGGFGHVGTARIAQAIGSKATLGVVRFDGHPGLDGKSGDAIF